MGVHFALFVAHAATEGHCTGVAALEVIEQEFVAFLVFSQDLDRAFEHDRHVRKRIADMHEGLPQLDAAQLADGGDFLHQVVFEHEAEMFLDLRVQFLILIFSALRPQFTPSNAAFKICFTEAIFPSRILGIAFILPH